jgi:hypothetical protein
MIRRDVTRVGLTFFYLITGLIAALLALKSKDIGHASFAVLAVCLAGHTLRYTHLKQPLLDPRFYGSTSRL